MKIIKYLHAVLAIALALFFIYKAYGKMTHPKLRDIQEKMVVEQIIQKGNYSPPVGYNITMNTFTQSGFMQMINVFQLLAAVLIIIPQTRLVGLLLLLPIIFNIFFMHVFFDNRPHEYIETGIPLFATILLLVFYYKQLRPVLWLAR